MGQQGRGYLTAEADRDTIMLLVKEAYEAGASKPKACEILGITERTLQRWKKSKTRYDGRLIVEVAPHNKLTEIERQKVLKVVNLPEFSHLPASKIVPILADRKEYIGSESTIYRILKAEGQLKHRLSSRPKKSHEVKAVKATAPNQLYSWDITYLPTLTRGVFFYLYIIMDVYSRKIVGWQIYDRECSEFASDLIEDVCQREGVQPGQVTLHSDNGGPMKGATMLATLQRLGVIPSFSRPAVSNDNPYSESLFKTLKYCPSFPNKPFHLVLEARKWVEGFATWYNEEHRHSGIKFVTPAQRHNGQDRAILMTRHQVYQEAKEKHPERWARNTRNWTMIEEVWLNPNSSTKNKSNSMMAA